MKRWTAPSCLVALVLVGCSSSKAPDTEMSTAPTGLWISAADSGTTIDIQSGGVINVTQGGQESHGTWKETTKGQIDAQIGGQTYNMPYTRRDLKLMITLPGQTQPTEMQQM